MPGGQDLKKKLQDAVKSGNIALSSDGFSKEGDPVGAMGDIQGDTSTLVPRVATQDPLINAATKGAGEALSKSSDAAASKGSTLEDPNNPMTKEQVVLTEPERNAFLDALISGKRYEQRFVLFGGRVRGKLRCRSTEESEAIAAWLELGIRESRYHSPMDYSLAIRNALLATQVVELNGVRYPELTAPLFRTQLGETTQEPGWVKSADHWSKTPEAVLSGVYDELRLFEKKYWTMVSHARDQNFWPPAGSTSV